MAIEDVTDLWQLAATLMGNRGTSEIADATNPTKPIERTFATIYDEVRRSSLRDLLPDFAIRTQALVAAPGIDFELDPVTWPRSGHWRHIYREPSESIKFIGFDTDRPAQMFASPYRKVPIAVAYASDTVTPSGVTYTWVATQNRLFPGTISVEYRGNRGTERKLVDKSNGGYSVGGGHTFDITVAGYSTNVIDTLSSTSTGYPSPNLVIDWTLVNSTTTDTNIPISIEVDYAYAPDSAADWTEHIFTDLSSAIGKFLIDVVDPSLWSDEFQLAVATRLARRGALVHAKSSRLVSGLNQESAIADSNAVSEDNADESLSGPVMSATEAARL